MKHNNSIICFGEVLWDVLPTHKVAGGAPMNVAFHANNFGINSQMISAVGQDDLGKELLKFLEEKNISTDLIHINESYDTSTVQVTLDEKGSASYEIVAPVAWDLLVHSEAGATAVSNADILLFGSLICRSEGNIKALLVLIEKAKKTVFDVNLRPPFYSQSLIELLLEKANIVKMNDEELIEIISWYGVEGSLKEQMLFVMEKFDIETIIMTEGAHGAHCLHDNILYSQKSFSVKVQDTVGSGDSFLAAFICKMLEGLDWQNCLEFACGTGALVATKSGGTPVINESMVIDFISKNKEKIFNEK